MNQNGGPSRPNKWSEWNTTLSRITNEQTVNLIAMLLWQALLMAYAVAVSHMGWYLPDATPGEMGLQYGLIAFGFYAPQWYSHVGGVRDSLAMRASLHKSIVMTNGKGVKCA